MRPLRWLVRHGAACLAACLLTLSSALAGQTCEREPPGALEVYSALELAHDAFDALDASGARVAFIARAGQNLSRYGLHYSHIGLVWRDHPQGRWTVVHLLNECATERADLFNQGLGDFFLDSMVEYDTLIIIPGEDVQQRLVEALAAGRERELFTAHYSLLAYPFATEYENSNQWVLEFFAARMLGGAQPKTRRAAQDWLRGAGFLPSAIHVSALERLGAGLTRVNVRFDDHPRAARVAGTFETVTVDSMEAFLPRVDPGCRELHLSLAHPL